MLKTVLIVAGVASALAVGAGVASAAPDPDGNACAIVAPDAADLLRGLPVIGMLPGNVIGQLGDDSEILRARKDLGCGPAPNRTPEQIKAAVCSALTPATVDDLAARLHADQQARDMIDQARPVLPAALALARQQLGCTAAPAPAPAPTTPATPAPTTDRGTATARTCVDATDHHRDGVGAACARIDSAASGIGASTAQTPGSADYGQIGGTAPVGGINTGA